MRLIEDAIAAVDDRAGQAVRLHQGVVAGFTDAGIPRVTVAGTTLEMVAIGDHTAGDVVQVLSAGGRWVVLGTVTPDSGPNLVPNPDFSHDLVGWQWRPGGACVIINDPPVLRFNNAELTDGSTDSGLINSSTVAALTALGGDPFTDASAPGLWMKAERANAIADNLSYAMDYAGNGAGGLSDYGIPFLRWESMDGATLPALYGQASMRWENAGGMGVQFSWVESRAAIGLSYHRVVGVVDYALLVVGADPDGSGAAGVTGVVHIPMDTPFKVSWGIDHNPALDASPATLTVRLYLNPDGVGEPDEEISVPYTEVSLFDSYTFGGFPVMWDDTYEGIFTDGNVNPAATVFRFDDLSLGSAGWASAEGTPADYAPPSISLAPALISGHQDLLITGVDPFDLQLYSLPISVQPGQELSLSARVSANVPVTAGVKLLAWYGATAEATLPGQPGFSAATLAVADLTTTIATHGGATAVPAGKNYVRLAVEIDTCTSGTASVEARLGDVSVR